MFKNLTDKYDLYIQTKEDENFREGYPGLVFLHEKGFHFHDEKEIEVLVDGAQYSTNIKKENVKEISLVDYETLSDLFYYEDGQGKKYENKVTDMLKKYS